VAELALEFFILFFVAPTLFTMRRHRLPAIPMLWVMAAYCLIVLLRNPQFDAQRLWQTGNVGAYAPGILGLFALVLAIGIALVLRYDRRRFLQFPKSKPRLWMAVMIIYPLLSVYPQGIIYREFMFNRYHELFGGGIGMVLASASAFAYVHIIFRNRLAVGLTFIAGILFALRYLQTDSLLISCFEHALYGCAIFTIGLGRWFFYAAMREDRERRQSLDAVAKLG
jgi:hypothetical protein